MTVETASQQTEEPEVVVAVTEQEPIGLPSQYEILAKISQGGMGVIYKARHRLTGAYSAIKILHKQFAEDKEAIKRFQCEAQAASVLRHPSLITVHDFGITSNHGPFIVMDWIDGISLELKVKRDGTPNTVEATLITLQTARALAYAHELKVVHRDLKPENIMLTRDSEGRTEVRVVDFGIAKILPGSEKLPESLSLTQTGTVVGSPIYMSPEQGLGQPVDERSDIYSLGCVLYFMLTGSAPFVGANQVETICRHINDPVPEMICPDRTIPHDLQMIAKRALEKDPSDRYQTMRELCADLERFLQGQTIQNKLSSRRLQLKTALRSGVSFVAGFTLTYAIAVAVQHFLFR